MKVGDIELDAALKKRFGDDAPIRIMDHRTMKSGNVQVYVEVDSEHPEHRLMVFNTQHQLILDEARR